LAGADEGTAGASPGGLPSALEQDGGTVAGYDLGRVRKAIDALPDGYRTVFSLYAVEGYDHEEIAQIMGITPSTSKSQYSRAKAKVRQLHQAMAV
jgi:RNA polymerase sigma-70 factor (ECF subfamily)